jgi:hypothetical protein
MRKSRPGGALRRTTWFWVRFCMRGRPRRRAGNLVDEETIELTKSRVTELRDQIN